MRNYRKFKAKFSKEQRAEYMKSKRRDIDAAVFSLVRELTPEQTAQVVARAAFHTYSPKNCLAMEVQAAALGIELTGCVRGCKSWQKTDGFTVRKGEKGMMVLIPNVRKVPVVGSTGQPTGETELKVTGYKTGYVFDITQTNCPCVEEYLQDKRESTAFNEERALRLMKLIEDNKHKTAAVA